MSRLRILHLSDIHIGMLKYSSINELAVKICEDIERQGNLAVDVVVVTGDIFDGRVLRDDLERSVEIAVDFFKNLLKFLKQGLSPSMCEEHFIFVPGNHDVIRNESGDVFKAYKQFLKCFHGENTYKELYDDQHLYTVRTFANHNVAIVGLNSCRLEKNDILKKLVEINVKVYNLEESKKELCEKSLIENLKALKEDSLEEWLDYGYIEKIALREAFQKLKGKLSDVKKYTIVAAFHHHFYPFPEIYGKYGDAALIKNFSDVMSSLSHYNVSMVMHGHKHMPLIKELPKENYCDGNSSFFIFSGGSIGYKDAPTSSFQILDVFEPGENFTKARVYRFEYSYEELRKVEPYDIPPRIKGKKTEPLDIINELQIELPNEYREYTDNIYEKDLLANSIEVDKLIEHIANTMSVFDRVKEALLKNPNYIFYILLAIHYRVNTICKKIGGHQDGNCEIRNSIKDYFLNYFDENYVTCIISLLEETDRSKHGVLCKKLSEEFQLPESRRITSLITVCSFLTDLYLALRKYADFYYDKIKYNTNIKLEKGKFGKEVPPMCIAFSSDSERKAILIKLKSKDPTCHKVAVLIIKEFENEMLRVDLEKSFKELGINIFYLIPKVETENYELENSNFEAYIPTLLPILIGSRLYKQKEVFIRELIQNSIDAILLREDLQKKMTGTTEFSKTIKIIFGKEKKSNPHFNDRKVFVNYIRVVDEGSGMDMFHIQRYFLNIGRSFYTSDEFGELKVSKKTDYNPISNFGIGFLSSFMVCKEISVKSKNYLEEDGVEVYIPNYEGCFFVRKDKSINTVGTTITLYENPDNPFNINNILKYLHDVIKDIVLDIEIVFEEDSNRKEFKPALSLKNTLPVKKIINPVFFVPLDEYGIKKTNWPTENIYEHNYGVAFISVPSLETSKQTMLNAGIALTEEKRIFFPQNCFDVIINFPPAYTRLDVTRESIKDFKSDELSFDNDKLKLKIVNILSNQILQWLYVIRGNKTSVKLCDPLKMRNFLYLSGFHDLQELEKQLITVNIGYDNERGTFSIYADTFRDSNSFKYAKRILNSSHIMEVLMLSFAHIFKMLICKLKNVWLQRSCESELERDIEGTIQSRIKNYLNIIAGRDFEREFETGFEQTHNYYISKYLQRDEKRDEKGYSETEYERYTERGFMKESQLSYEKYYEEYIKKCFGTYLDKMHRSVSQNLFKVFGGIFTSLCLKFHSMLYLNTYEDYSNTIELSIKDMLDKYTIKDNSF